MKISELQELLEKAKEEYGDIPVRLEQYGMYFNFNAKMDEEENILVIS